MAGITPNHRQMNRRHRRLGLGAALFVLFLSVTGVLLNHTTDLALNRTYLQNRLLLLLYGVDVPAPTTYRAGTQWITQLGARLYLNETEIAQTRASLVGALDYRGMRIAATTEALWIFTPAGERVERLEPAGDLPAFPKALATTEAGALALGTEHGWFVTDETFFPWHPAPPPSKKQIATASPPPQDLEQRLAEKYRGKTVTLERVVLDLHTGRLFGPAGTYLVDLIALALIGLAITGITARIKRSRRSDTGGY